MSRPPDNPSTVCLRIHYVTVSLLGLSFCNSPPRYSFHLSHTLFHFCGQPLLWYVTFSASMHQSMSAFHSFNVGEASAPHCLATFLLATAKPKVDHVRWARVRSVGAQIFKRQTVGVNICDQIYAVHDFPPILSYHWTGPQNMLEDTDLSTFPSTEVCNSLSHSC